MTTNLDVLVQALPHLEGKLRAIVGKRADLGLMENWNGEDSPIGVMGAFDWGDTVDGARFWNNVASGLMPSKRGRATAARPLARTNDPDEDLSGVPLPRHIHHETADGAVVSLVRDRPARLSPSKRHPDTDWLGRLVEGDEPFIHVVHDMLAHGIDPVMTVTTAAMLIAARSAP